MSACRRPAAVALLALALGALILGCGGGSDSAAITRAEFAKQANGICAHAEARKNAALQAYFARTQQAPQGADEIKLVTTVALPPIKAMSEELGQLPIPSDGGNKAEAIVVAFETAIAKVEADPKSVLSQTNDPFGEANKLAAKSGMKACAAI
jgi:hypothetical protein